jgi:predicted aspartyl protease
MTRRLFHLLKAVVLAAFLLPIPSLAAHHHKTKDMQSLAGQAERTEIPIRVYRGYLVIVEGSIWNLERQNVLVDTGTDRSIVNTRIARSLGLPATKGKLTVANASVETEAMVLPELRVGPVHRTNLPVSVHDLDLLEHDLGIPMAAVIGLDVLGQTSFRLDYFAKRLIFGPVAVQGISLPFEGERPFVTISLVVGNENLHLLVDTGAAGLIFFESRVGKRLALGELSGMRRDSTLVGSFQTQIVSPGELRLGGRQFHLQKAFLAKDRQDASTTFDGLFGVGAMGFKSVAFDFESNVVYLQI